MENQPDVNNQNLQPTANPKPRNYWVIAGIALVVIVIIGGVYTLFLNTSYPMPISKLSLNPKETTDWKTYRDKEFGFEFRYPTDFPEVGHSSFYNFTLFNNYDFQKKEDSVEVTIDIDSYSRSSNMELFQRLLKATRGQKIKSTAGSYMKIEDLIIAGSPAVRYSEKHNARLDDAAPPLEQVLIKGDAFIFHISLYGIKKREIIEKYTKIFYQILSTFKFTP